MQNTDWIDTVEEIFGSVLSAVESQDYSGLSKNIEKKVNKAVGKVNDTVSDINEKINANLNPGKNQKRPNATQDWVDNRREQERTQGKQGYTNRMYSSQAGDVRNGAAVNAKGANPKVPVKRMQYPQLYRQNPPGTYSGPVFKVLGALGTTLFGAATFVLTIVGLATGAFGVWLANFITTTCLGGSIASLAYGTKMQNLVNRFKTYVKQIGDRQYCELERLAATVGKKKSFVEKEIRKMINNGYFLQGHLDDSGKTLITSDSMYQNYLNAENSRKLREQKEIEDIKIREITNGYPEKVRQILEEGERYIQHVHEANDIIPGEVMSEKLYRLEDIMRRIFEQLKKDPSSADDLQKLMKYYLPTTTKLIDAYKDLDGKPSYGENNIANTKKEIEDTMDIIINAFGKIFDDMFQDAAWDISTEISTMKTMLAKEGLTGERDFVLNKDSKETLQ